MELLYKLKEIGVNTSYNGAAVKDTKIKNLRVLVTGSIEGSTREQIKKLLISYGANVVSSASSLTDLVFAGEKSSEAKIQKASNADIIKVRNIKDIEEYVN
jgi:DNA ligase (NAD+)